MGKTDHGDNCQGENGGVKNAWGKCLWGFTDRIKNSESYAYKVAIPAFKALYACKYLYNLICWTSF